MNRDQTALYHFLFFTCFFFFLLLVVAKINTNQRGTGTVVVYVIQKYCGNRYKKYYSIIVVVD